MSLDNCLSYLTNLFGMPVLVGRSGQRTFDRPSPLQPRIDEVSFYTVSFCPVGNTECFSGYGINQSVPPVSRLFFIGCPSTIVGFVITIIVNSFYRVFGGRSLAHILAKCLKTIQPAVTNHYTPPSVITPPGVVWIITTVLDCVPRPKFGCPGHSVNGLEHGFYTPIFGPFPFVTPATNVWVISFKSGRGDILNRAAVTTAKPPRSTIFTPDKPKNYPPAVPITRQVYEFWTVYYRMIVCHVASLTGGMILMRRKVLQHFTPPLFYHNTPMITSDSAIKLCISQYLQADMRYMVAHPIETGTGRFKKRIPRRIGHTEDHLFSLELWGKPDKVSKLVFMSLADSPPIVLSQALIAVKGVLSTVLPDYEGWDKLVEEVDNGRDATIGDVRATFQQLTESVRVLFVNIG